jgi:hypothetical protein
MINDPNSPENKEKYEKFQKWVFGATFMNYAMAHWTRKYVVATLPHSHSLTQSLCLTFSLSLAL